MSEINTEFSQNYQMMSDFKGFPELPNERTFAGTTREKMYLSKVFENMQANNLDPMVLPVPSMSLVGWQNIFNNSDEQLCLPRSRRATRMLGKISGLHTETPDKSRRWRKAIISRNIVGIYLGDSSMQSDECNKIRNITGAIGANARELLSSAAPSINMYLAAQLIESLSKEPKMNGAVLLGDRKSAGKPLCVMAEATDKILDPTEPRQIKVGTFAARNASLGIMLGVEFEL